MSNRWSKEDRNNFENSEVMKELQTIVIDTIKRADILNEKIKKKSSDFGGVAGEAGEAAEEVANLNKQLTEFKQISSADDGEEDSAEDLESEVVDDLRLLAEAAISEGNYKLAYRIERTISEIKEESVACT